MFAQSMLELAILFGIWIVILWIIKTIFPSITLSYNPFKWRLNEKKKKLGEVVETNEFIKEEIKVTKILDKEQEILVKNQETLTTLDQKTTKKENE